MTSISPEAFDRKPLIESIRKAQLTLDKLLEEATDGELEEALLRETNREIGKLKELVKSRLELIRILKFT